MSKKLLSIFALFVLVLAMAPADALAQTGITGILVQVHKGNSLSKLAEERYGDPQAYPAIVNYHNHQAEIYPNVFTYITDSNVIEEGQIIALPGREYVSKYMSTADVVSLPDTVNLLEDNITGILVQKDDWLSKFAKELYGDPQAYPAIVNYHNHQAEIYPNVFTYITDSNVIKEGQIIAFDLADMSNYRP